jgi:hypothetical protein
MPRQIIKISRAKISGESMTNEIFSIQLLGHPRVQAMAELVFGRKLNAKRKA